MSRIFFALLYAAFVACAHLLRTHLLNGTQSEIWGWDYMTFVRQIGDWRWIAYTGFRHPGLGMVLSPLVALQHVWSDAYLWIMPAISTATAYLIQRLGGWLACGIWIAFPTTWILAGTPESFPVAQLFLVFSIYWMRFRGASLGSVAVLSAINGAVTLTNGIKPALSYFCFGMAKRNRLRVLAAGGIVAALGVAFFLARAECSGKDWTDGIRATLAWIPASRNLLREAYGFFVLPVGWAGFLAYPLAALGIVRCWRERWVRQLAVFFSVDALIHLVIGWGMDEPMVFAPHWTWMLAILGGQFSGRTCGSVRESK